MQENVRCCLYHAYVSDINVRNTVHILFDEFPHKTRAPISLGR